jgi:DNA repair photolyase
VDPAITRKRAIEGRPVHSHARLRVVAIEPLGVDLPLVDITTGTGDFIANGIVSHNCYARRTHWFLDEDGVNQWDTKVFVKINAPDLLRVELRRPGWKRELVAIGTATDPYQAIEGRYRITRRILEALRDVQTPVSLITRCPMIVRDVDILRDLARGPGVTVCVSVATTDTRLAREIEPTVAPPAQRLQIVERLAAAGIRTGVMLAPILPGLTDQAAHIEAVLRAARYHGAHFVGHNVLHLGEITRDVFTRFLRDRYPGLVPLYRRLYPRKYAPRGYRAAIGKIVLEAKERLGIRQPRYVGSAPVARQLALFDP